VKENKLIFKIQITVFSVLILIFGCSPQKVVYPVENSIDYTAVSANDSIDPSVTNDVIHVDTSGYVDLTYDLDIGTSSKDVYFIFTNTALSAAGSNPQVLSSNIHDTGKSLKMIRSTDNAKNNNRPELVRGRPYISDFNKDAFGYTDTANVTQSYNSRSLFIPPKNRDIVNDTTNFLDKDMFNHTVLIPATCRKVIDNSPDSDRKLNIWVADDCWIGSTKLYDITQPMVDAMADKFLKAGANNDIYDWVTKIYGVEWGSDASVIDPTLIGFNKEITILLYDIDGDNSGTGGVLGYFWAKDNFKKSSVSYSNERIMFYIDAVMYANFDPTPPWDITDGWPSEMISTLAHEFQHMIHFYQKGVKVTYASSMTDSWINEMTAMLTEDFVANKIYVEGPRGVDYTVASAGSSGNHNGRPPRFNRYDYYSVTNWLGNVNNYSVDYVFGAYLARNFGGVKLFSDIMLNDFTDERAVTEAIKTISGKDLNIGQLIQKWGAAVLLSDSEDPTSDVYQFNKGNNWFSSNINSITYTIGSIDLNNYTHTYNPDYDLPSPDQVGPLIYNSANDIPSSGSMRSASNVYYFCGNLTGQNSWNLRMDNGVKLTVVVK
jgi:hypothetical protein